MRFISIPAYGEQFLIDDETREATVILGRFKRIGGEERHNGLPYELALETVELARSNKRITVELGV